MPIHARELLGKLALNPPAGYDGLQCFARRRDRPWVIISSVTSTLLELLDNVLRLASKANAPTAPAM